ncbi:MULTISPECIES: DUF3833 family protein [unclassified Leisingera]|uniref:DUF3833 family protein n=1 Tax=unclassified Leisingera TaxID=2614906 RepID=UPI00035E805C|nr:MULTISPECIES: DUF3833 family protein [unclassified Leisingera]KIC25487.1 hypothetical protein RA23_06395 [Leisingera sp. ANG-S3]KIC54409.1 hypothetical protein RA22_07150 [Leisingera sp. ANG-S]KID10770.1 hypothetical protein GC1_03605 [Leisingera sp. ANG1]
MKLLTLCLAIALLAMIAKTFLFSFRFQSPPDYADTGPHFILTEHLSGEILSEGVIFGPTGKMANSFTAKMVGEWDGRTGTLSEEFTYSNGVTQSRKWFLTLGPGNTFTATADDLVGEAQGIVSGSTVQLQYEITLPESAGGYTLKATDWLYLTADGVIMNRAEMRKFGVKVAELVATMRPAP